jgi:hypothetical protein
MAIEKKLDKPSEIIFRALIFLQKWLVLLKPVDKDRIGKIMVIVLEWTLWLF